jgi:hypothetical protein
VGNPDNHSKWAVGNPDSHTRVAGFLPAVILAEDVVRPRYRLKQQSQSQETGCSRIRHCAGRANFRGWRGFLVAYGGTQHSPRDSHQMQPWRWASCSRVFVLSGPGSPHPRRINSFWQHQFQFEARCWNVGCVPPSRPVRIAIVDVPRSTNSAISASSRRSFCATAAARSGEIW